MDLTYLPHATEGHMTATPEVLALWKDVKDYSDFKHIFEIGTNGGHSAAIVLTLFPDVKVTSIDIGHHPYTAEAVKVLKERFGDRFEYIEMSTLDYFEKIKSGEVTFPEGVDIINIDGGHDYNVASNDIQLAKHVGLKNILIDDFRMYGVPKAFEANKENLSVTAVYEYKYGRENVAMALVHHETD